MKRKGVVRRLRVLPVWVILMVALSWGTGVAGQAGDGSDMNTTEALIELLKAKGVIDEAEAKGFLERHKLKTKASQQVIEILPRKNKDAYMKELTENVTQNVTRQINEVRKDSVSSNQYLARRSVLLEQEVEKLSDALEKEKTVRRNSWSERIRFGGDIRVRHESVLLDSDNALNIEDKNNPGTFMNTTNDKNRQRIRLRVGMKAKIIKAKDVSELFGLREHEKIHVGEVDAEIRVATGSVGNPVSTNHTLGDDSDSRSDIVLDRANLKWSYKPREEVWGGKFPQASATFGIMENPWFTASSLVWDSDLAFEGVALNFRTDTVKINPFKAFLTMGYFPIQESEWSQDDKYLLGAQAGISHKPFYGWQYKLAAAYYDYYNVEGSPFTGDRFESDLREMQHMTPKFRQKGNSDFQMDNTNESEKYDGLGLLADFELLNLTGQLTNTFFWPVHVTVYWDWVKNLGYDSAKMAEKSSLVSTTAVSAADIEEASGDTGYQLGLRVGYPKVRDRGQWSLSLAYRYVESDAVLDAFTDSDFHMGGTNNKGFIFEGELGLFKNVWLKARWMSANEITDMQEDELLHLAPQDEDLAVDTFQLDLNAAF
ncbi:MAG: putative porin [Desulfobacter sp.]|nr:MAG: putative porin [Desulfobacter sp.]